MFYEGDLQSGINKALQESKLVACFVTDNGEESSLWEEDFLEDPSIKSSLTAQTIPLRLVAGSAEAGYLSAIFPLPRTPTLVIIENGQLKEYIAAGVSKEEFMRRLLAVFQLRGVVTTLQDGASAAGDLTVASPAAAEAPFSQPTISSVESGMVSASTAAASQSQNPLAPTMIAQAAESSSPQSSQAIQSLLMERKAKLDAHKKDQEAKDKAKQTADTKARKAALEAAASGTPQDAQKSADMKYALMEKKRQQQARDERARILKRVEDDKEERRQKEAQRRAIAKAKETPESSPTFAASSSIAPPSSTYSKECALQIRLFDGSTIRSRFPSSGSIRADVRPWIDGQQSSDTPYTFKQVLSPLPNKNISISDEEQTLFTQGLTPSATLILVPVQGYKNAYEDSSAGMVSRGVSAGFGMVSSGVGLVSGVLGSLFGGAPQAPAAESSPVQQPANLNVRTLRDQDRAEDHQFYNGNALNFEPRNDRDDKKED